MDLRENLNEIYKLYENKNYPEAMKKVQGILAIEPENVYAKRYENLLKPFLNDKSEVWKIATIKGKNLSCPHCQSAISLSALNDEQKTKIRENNYENLSIKCPYCHTIFTLQKKSENSIIWIKIWDAIFYNQKNYRVVWAVNYSWKWYENSYSWELNYLEWILLGEDNSYLYFSEWYFYDDGEKKYEFEISQKVTPNFDVEFKNDKIYINAIPNNFSEKNIVTAKSLYWENSKVFTVWEKVELFEFSYLWQNYVLEKESAWRQAEAGIYKTWTVSKSKAFEIFWKEMSSSEKVWNIYDFIVSYISYIFIWLIFWGSIISEISNSLWISTKYLFFWIFIIIFWIFAFIFGFYKLKMFHLFFSWPIFAFLVFFIWNNIFENKQEISLKNISEWKKFEVIFNDSDLTKTSVSRIENYDYGGVRTYYDRIKWFNFSVLDENDKEIIEKIQSWENIPDEIKKIFSEKIYKLK